ncbi:MAG: DUF1192 domain-containing protein [Brevundimonas sp.]
MFEDLEPRPSRDILTSLAREDLDPYSVEDLKARILVLESEIQRANAAIQTKTAKKSAADAFFNLGG